MFDIKSFSFLILTISLCHGQSTYFRSFSTSVFAMTRLAETENWLVRSALRLLDLCELQGMDRTSLLGYLHKLNEDYDKSKGHLEAHLSNPLNIFILIRRLYQVWPLIIDSLDSHGILMKKLIADHKIILPQKHDLAEAAQGMERIRTTYNLNVADMADGILDGVKYDARLSNSDLYAIALELASLEDSTNEIIASWVKASVHSKNIDFLPNGIPRFNRKAADALYFKTVISEDEIPCDDDLSAIESFESLCRGEHLTVHTNLSCRLNATFNPFYLLAPIKMEELSRDPYIVLYYDVLEDNDISNLTKAAGNELTRSTVHGAKGPSRIRTSQNAWIDVSPKIFRKIISISGLEAAGFETPSVLNYGLGGHYDTHFDYFHPHVGPIVHLRGDRKATVLLYLRDVEQGGATVFPSIRLQIPPKKGSLLLWHNLKNSGEPDKNTLHAACPIIFGSKWVLNLWIRERDQFRAMPCYNQ